MSTSSTSTSTGGSAGGAPVAGWYADPSGQGERWWDGAVWTDHVRAVPVAPLAGMGAYGGATSVPGAYGGATSVPGAYGQTAPWAGMPLGPAPKNGVATAAFVLGLVMLVGGVLTGYYIGSFLVVVLAVSGLKRSREIAAQGHGPVGRARAAWGLALSVLMLVLVVALDVAAF